MWQNSKATTERCSICCPQQKNAQIRTLESRNTCSTSAYLNTDEPTWALGKEDRYSSLKPDASVEWSFQTIEQPFTLEICDPNDTWWDPPIRWFPCVLNSWWPLTPATHKTTSPMSHLAIQNWRSLSGEKSIFQPLLDLKEVHRVFTHRLFYIFQLIS